MYIYLTNSITKKVILKKVFDNLKLGGALTESFKHVFENGVGKFVAENLFEMASPNALKFSYDRFRCFCLVVIE